MKIIALIPSINRGYVLYKTIADLETLNQVDDIIVLSEKIPQGVAKARRQLVNIAYEKYGDGCIFLMLNDDCTFTDQSNIKWAAEYFNENPNLGLLQFPVKAPHKDVFLEKPTAFHCFMFRSDLVGKGINYTDGEHLDEILFSLDIFFAGYDIGMTLRCIIPHHVAINESNAIQGGIFNSIKDGFIKPQSFITKKYAGLIKWKKGHYMFSDLPDIFSIVPNNKGYELHQKNNNLISK
jgi:hypothetical protein